MVDETVGTTGLAGGSNEDKQGTHTQGAGAPQGAPAPSVPTHAPSGELSADIANILKEVKLPERRDTKGAGDKKTPKQIEVSPLLSDIPVSTSATQIPASEAASAPVTRQEPPAPEEKPATPPPSVVALHTLKDDLKGVVREQKISVVRAAALEQEKRGTPERIPESRFGDRVRGIIFTMFILAILGGAALGGVYYFASRNAPASVPQTGDSLVFAEKSAVLSLSGNSSAALKAQLAEMRQGTNAALGTITRIMPVVTDTSSGSQQARAATLSEFFSALGVQPPEELIRALAQNFFLGIHTVDKNAPVLVIPVTSYDHAFAGMLSWESTMNSSLAPLFTPVSSLVQVNGIPTERAFKDDVFRNYDVRTLSDDAGSVVLYYSFPTRNVLVIAESPYTFTEILTRLQALNNL